MANGAFGVCNLVKI